MSQSNTTVRPLHYEDLGDFWEIHDGHCPSDKTRQVEWFNKLMTELPDFAYYGAFRECKMVGGMAIGDFELNLRSQMIKLSSVGMVKTDMLHKKEKICKDMMMYFIEANRQKGVNMLTLTPFRPDFYRQMGFGYGSSLYTYRIPPLSFPHHAAKDFLSYTDVSEKQGVIDCFNRVCAKTHGAITTAWMLGIWEEGKRIVVYKASGTIRGVLVFSYGKDRELVIEDMFYEDTTVLLSFCSFLHSQSDQFDRVIYTTPDEYFYYLLHDPTDGMANNECCTSTINNMFRVIDVAGLFRELCHVNFNTQNAVLEISIEDTFYPKNNGETIIELSDGKATVLSRHIPQNHEHIKIQLDITDFSSLIMGAIDIKTLYRLGLLKISNASSLDLLDNIFASEQKPLSVGGL